jgi:uncharacterized membrane-anchored protein YitT (DUF2179 family)
MRKAVSQFIAKTFLNPFRETEHMSDSRIGRARKHLRFRKGFKEIAIDIFLIILGILSAGFGLQGFLLANGFLDGGATGISLLLTKITGASLSVILILVNLPFLVMAFRVIGKAFAIKALLAIIGLALAVAVVPYPQITSDKLLIAVFGGFFLGTGIGLAIRGGAVIDGTEVLAISLSRRLGISIGDVIMIVNIIIFSFGAYLINIETALYAMLTYLSASRTVDFLLEGIEEYTGVMVVSEKANEIRTMIAHGMNYGVTVYKGDKGFGKTGVKENDINILYTVLTRLEINKLKKEVYNIDPNAFMVMHSVKDTVGGLTKKRRHKH